MLKRNSLLVLMTVMVLQLFTGCWLLGTYESPSNTYMGKFYCRCYFDESFKTPVGKGIVCSLRNNEINDGNKLDSQKTDDWGYIEFIYYKDDYDKYGFSSFENSQEERKKYYIRINDPEENGYNPNYETIDDYPDLNPTAQNAVWLKER